MNVSGDTSARWLCAIIFSAVLVAGCGSGDDPADPAARVRVIHGNSSKGPLNGATIRAFRVDDRGQKMAGVLGETVTDASGNWLLALPPGEQPLLIESSGGAYVDEADPASSPEQRRTIALGNNDVFATVLSAGDSSVAINIYTDALLRKSRHETQGEDFFEVYELNRQFFDDAFGFDISVTQPADPIQPDPAAALASRQYGMALGGIANIVNSVATANQMPAPDYAVIAAVMEDMTDCHVDGRGVAGPLQGITGIDVSLNVEILRFRNNNFSAYAATPLLQIDQAACARSGLLPDGAAPVLTGVPAEFTVESPDGQGIASSAATLQALVQGIQAIDDRDGNLMPLSDLPAFLPLGATEVTFSASDQAGNTVFAMLTVNVAEPQAPTIVAPPDVVIRGQPGRPVVVELGTPIVSDNVSVLPQLLVENDAPQAGFSTGQFIVRWTVTDEIGLTAMDEQRVFVGVSPELNRVEPDFGVLPDFPGDDFATPVRPVPRSGRSLSPDSDGDGVADVLELQLGSDAFSPDSDGDTLDDALEYAIGSDPHQSSQHVYVSQNDTERSFAVAGTDAGRPLVIRLAAGTHSTPIKLSKPCDNVLLLGSGAGATVPRVTIAGCNNVRLFRLNAVGPGNALRVTDSTVTLRGSSYASFDVPRGSVLLAADSDVYLEAATVTGSIILKGDSSIMADCGSQIDVQTNNTSGSIYRVCSAL